MYIKSVKKNSRPVGIHVKVVFCCDSLCPTSPPTSKSKINGVNPQLGNLVSSHKSFRFGAWAPQCVGGKLEVGLWGRWTS